MALKLIIPPITEPVTPDQAKAQIRVDGDYEDSLIQSYITAARQHSEAVTRRAYCPQTWELIADSFPEYFVLPLPPLQSASSIKYKDRDGVEYTVDPSAYIVDTDSEPGRIVLAPGKSWPSGCLYPVGAVRVRFVAGYATVDDVPQSLKQAILLRVAHWHENREPIIVGTSVIPMPFTIDALEWPYRVFSF